MSLRPRAEFPRVLIEWYAATLLALLREYRVTPWVFRWGATLVDETSSIEKSLA